MVDARVRQAKDAFVGTPGATTIAATFDAPVLAGSAIVVFPTNDTGVAGTASVADNLNGAYPAALQTINDAVTGTRMEAFVQSNVLAGATTVTITWTGSVFSRGIHIRECIGVLSSPVDQSAGQTQATPGLAEAAVNSTATAALATAQSLALLMCINGAGTHTPLVVPTQGWANDGDCWSGFSAPNIGRAASKLVTGTAGVTGVCTALNNNAHSTIVVVLKATPDPGYRYFRTKTPGGLYLSDPGDGDFPAELVLKRWF